MSKVKCMICGGEFDIITKPHLKNHGFTKEEYLKRFPDTLLTSDKYREIRSASATKQHQKHPERSGMSGKQHTQEARDKQSKAKMGDKNPMKRPEVAKKQHEILKEMHKNSKVIFTEEGRKNKSKAATKRMTENNPMKNTEIAKKQGESFKIRYSEKPTEAMIKGRIKQGEAMKEKEPTDAMKEGRIKAGKKLSESQLGEKNHAWLGGISFLPYCSLFNEDLKERNREFFGRRCMKCGKTEQEQMDDMRARGKIPYRLIVHHVNYNKMVCYNDVEPLFAPLCASCNIKVNSNREYYEEYFTNLIMTEYNGKCFYTKEEMKLIKKL